MKNFIIVGRPNSGKTLFALSFAGYLGAKSVDMTFRSYDGMINCRHLLLEDAKKELCGMIKHKTRYLQSLVLKVTVGKTAVTFKLDDTCGIAEQIHADEAIRRGMAQTLSLLRSADYIFHIIDITVATKDYMLLERNIDREIYNYGTVRNNYCILTNKTDITTDKDALSRLSALFPQAVILPISALYGIGFREVKNYVARNV